KRYNAYNPVTPAPMIITSNCSTALVSFLTGDIRCRDFPIELSFRAFHRSGCHDRNWSPHTTTSSLHNRAIALAEAVETTIECSVVKVKRQSLKAPRATEGPVIALRQNTTKRG